MTLRRLALVFGFLSLFGFGGGKAILPQMHADVVDRYHWTTSPQFAQYFVIGRLAPGATNSISALVGFQVAGLAGAAITAAAMFVPSAIVVYLVGLGWRRFEENAWREVAARTMAPVVIGLSWAGVTAIARGAIDVPATYAIAGLTALAMLRSRLPITVVMSACAIAGIVFLR